MKGIVILKPALIVALASPGGTGLDNLKTPSPREVWQAPNQASVAINVDLGAVQSIDMLYLGATTAAAATTWTVYRTTDIAGTNPVVVAAARPVRLPGATGPKYAAIALLAAPANSRYFQIVIDGGASIEIGNLALGLSFRHPRELSGGRVPIDTSRRVSLPDGGFGIDAGVVKAGYRWRFVNLADAALDAFWDLARDRGEHRPIVVVEDDALDPPPARRVHYGLFDRFEAFERDNPAETRWALSIEEWV